MKRMLLGVGNVLSHDDGIGPTVARRLGGTEWTAVDCGTALENVGGLVSREAPDLLVVVDAARMGTPPGTARRIPLEQQSRMLGTTHGLPLAVALSFVAHAAGRIELIGVEPEDVSWGEGLSAATAEAVERLILTLKQGCLEQIPCLPEGGDVRQEEDVPTGLNAPAPERSTRSYCCSAPHRAVETPAGGCTQREE